MRTGLLIGLLCLFAGSPVQRLYAQQRGELQVVEDPLIALLQEVRAGKIAPSTPSVSGGGSSNAASGGTRTVMRGFRVQIFLGSSRNEAYAAQARFKRLFRDIDTYISYEEPNYRVKVGDFRSRSEAESMMRGLREQFSNVFIFTEDIFVYQ